MNLHRLVRGVIPLVNPDQEVVILRSTGYTVDDTGAADGRSMPEPVTVQAQVQRVPETVLQHVEGYNQSSIYRNMYLMGDWTGLSRATGQGGIWCTGTALRGWWIRCPRHGIPLPGGR